MTVTKTTITGWALGALTLATSFLASCNKESDSELYVDPANVAVTAFSLKFDSKVQGVDSTYFSIDLDRGVIYNADSLRKGTPVDKLVPVIKYSSKVESAIITMTGGTTRQGDVDYKNNPTDSIDFSGKVTLTLTANNGEMSRTYDIRVNVHREVADSLVWVDMTQTTLPSRLPNPLDQKTVQKDSKAVTLIRENDNTYTLAESIDLVANRWEKREIQLPFTPNVRSFTSTSADYYMLSTDGRLYKSSDAETWQATGQQWSVMIGPYLDSVLGLETTANGTSFAQYPQGTLNKVTIPEDFPVGGHSNFVTLQNKWTSSPVAFFVGGTLDNGSSTSATWAFDGTEWIKLSEGGIPAVDSASIIPYYAYRASSSGGSMNEYNVWMLVGGRLSDGSFNRTVYISYDNAVHWSRGMASMQLPESFPALSNCDNVVLGSVKTAPVVRAPMRISHSVDNGIITWTCPYIYLIGGNDPDGKLYSSIWRGVLTRLTFAPVF